MISRSGKLTPAAFTDTTTSRGPAVGDGTSSTTSDPGGPCCLHKTAFTRPGSLYRAARPPVNGIGPSAAADPRLGSSPGRQDRCHVPGQVLECATYRSVGPPPAR